MPQPDAHILCVGEPLVDLCDTQMADGEGTGKFGDGNIRINGFSGATIPNLASFLRETLNAHASANTATIDLFTAIGDDESSTKLLEKLQSLGLGTSHMKIIPCRHRLEASPTCSTPKATPPPGFWDGKERFKQEREHSATRDMFTGIVG